MECSITVTLHGCHGISNHWQLNSSFHRMFRLRVNTTVFITSPFEEKPLRVNGFPAWIASSTESIFMWRHHHGAVKLVYNEHPCSQVNMVFQDRWSQTTGKHEMQPVNSNYDDSCVHVCASFLICVLVLLARETLGSINVYAHVFGHQTNPFSQSFKISWHLGVWDYAMNESGIKQSTVWWRGSVSAKSKLYSTFIFVVVYQIP